MGARDLLADLASSGISVAADGDQLVIRPASRLTDQHRVAIRDAKPAILVMLRNKPAANDPGPPDTDHWNWPASQAMTSAEVERMQARLALFTARWLTASEAEALAARLVIRHREDDDRRCCAECAHLSRASTWRCARARAAGLNDAGLPSDLVAQLQRCRAFQQSHLPRP